MPCAGLVLALVCAPGWSAADARQRRCALGCCVLELAHGLDACAVKEMRHWVFSELGSGASSFGTARHDALLFGFEVEVASSPSSVDPGALSVEPCRVLRCLLVVLWLIRNR